MYFPTFSDIYSCVPRITLRIRTQTVLSSGNRSKMISTLSFLIQTVGRVRNSRKWGRQPSLLAWSRIPVLGIRDWHLLQKVKQVYIFPSKMDCLLAPWMWAQSVRSCCRVLNHDGNLRMGMVLLLLMPEVAQLILVHTVGTKTPRKKISKKLPHLNASRTFTLR